MQLKAFPTEMDELYEVIIIVSCAPAGAQSLLCC